MQSSLESLVYRKQIWFIYCTTKMKQQLKEKERRRKNRNSKSIFDLAKWTDFTPDNLSLCYYYNKCFSLLVRIQQPMLMP